VVAALVPIEICSKENKTTLTHAAKCETLPGGMTDRSAKAFHRFAALGLLACAACPVIEVICRSSDCIFLSGHDTETTVALLLIVLELSVASLKLFTAFFPGLVARLFAFGACRIAPAISLSSYVTSTASPPLTLRV
jgi:hypothetical protein